MADREELIQQIEAAAEGMSEQRLAHCCFVLALQALPGAAVEQDAWLEAGEAIENGVALAGEIFSAIVSGNDASIFEARRRSVLAQLYEVDLEEYEDSLSVLHLCMMLYQFLESSDLREAVVAVSSTYLDFVVNAATMRIAVVSGGVVDEAVSSPIVMASHDWSMAEILIDALFAAPWRL
ncbi:hypothetical protein [Promicromonospora soli]